MSTNPNGGAQKIWPQYNTMMKQSTADLNASVKFYNQHVRFLIQNMLFNTKFSYPLVAFMNTDKELDEYKAMLRENGQAEYI